MTVAAEEEQIGKVWLSCFLVAFTDKGELGNDIDDDDCRSPAVSVQPKDSGKLSCRTAIPPPSTGRKTNAHRLAANLNSAEVRGWVDLDEEAAYGVISQLFQTRPPYSSFLGLTTTACCWSPALSHHELHRRRLPS